MARSARVFGVSFDRDSAARILEPVAGQAALRCRLTLDASGRFDLTVADLGAPPAVWVLDLSPVTLSSQDLWLGHKSTRRAIYDQARANLPEGVDELLFVNEQGALCEGTITNLFVTLADGTHATPPLSAGLLPGILRETLLAEALAGKEVIEKNLAPGDLTTARAIFVGNSLRGLIKAEMKQA